MDLIVAPRPGPTARRCKRGEFPWLAGKAGSRAAVLCGRNAVQLTRREAAAVSLDDLARRLEGVGRSRATRSFCG